MATSVCTKDKDTLRELAGQIAEIAALPVHKKRQENAARYLDLFAASPAAAQVALPVQVKR